jgi:hypothetical protein
LAYVENRLSFQMVRLFGDESQPAQQADLISVLIKVFIGGQPANVLFRGRNACCSAVDTIYVTVPQGLTGCANSATAIPSSSVTARISPPRLAERRACVIRQHVLHGLGVS